MRQSNKIVSFEKVLAQRAIPLADRWAPLLDGTPIANPAKRAVAAGAVRSVSISAVRAVLALAEHSAAIRFVASADPAFVTVVTIQGTDETLVYRTRGEQVLTSTVLPQSPNAAILFASRFLVSRSADFSAAYLALLEGLEAKRDQAVLNGLVASAADELVQGIIDDLDQDALIWYYGASVSAGEIDEAEDPAGVDLVPLFADAKMLGQYLRGEATPFTVLERVPGTITGAASAPVTFSANTFFGKQLDLTVKFMRENRHVLHHGPTGTGKSFVWALAMKQLDPTFDADNYPYFVHGSAGLEDIDFTGNYVLRADGTRTWFDGPLVRAMKDGRRFKVEELNRLPGAMLNVLLGAMDYGRISLPRYDGQIVVAKPGFAVDAMANIGREYTATEEIDPAIMRRFTIKIEYDFLPADQEVLLLRSRHPGLKSEDAETLVRIAGSIRQAYEEGSGSVDVDLYVSPAALLNTAELVAGGEAEITEAIKLTFLTDVAWTKPKRESVLNLIELHLRDRKAGRRSPKSRP